MEAKNKHQPIRTCSGCRQRKLQHEMRRFVRFADGWRPDPAPRKRQPGRGAYVCSIACIEQLKKNRRYPGLASAAAEYGLISSSGKNDG